MSDKQQDRMHYVGPENPPESRTPPISEVGIVGWMRANLFGSMADTISTIITIGVVLWFLQSFLSWALFNAQWEVVFLNLANLGAGPEFPKSEMWRIEIAAFMLAFLAALSIGFWTKINRWIPILVVGILASMWIIPPATEGVEEPSIHYFLAADYDVRQSNFITEEGESYTFNIVPLLTEGQFAVGDVDGYIEDDNDLGNTSWNIINQTARNVRRDEVDPMQYDLNVAIVIRDADGETVAQSDFTEGEPEELTFTWEAPDSGWYTFTAVFDEENPGSMGFAWLQTEDLEVFYSTRTATEERLEQYGEPPELDCRNCATATNRTDLQYRGQRSLGQWFSLQLAPYMVGVREFFLFSTIISTLGYLLGQGAKRLPQKKLFSRLLVVLWILLLPAQLIVVNQTDEVTTDDFGGLFLTLLLSAVAIIASFPIGVALALGRQSELPVVKYLSTLFIEVVRGVPLITLLFAGRYIVPFFVDGLQDVASAIRMTIVLTVFSAAYLAEVIRGGLQIVPQGQLEAARALGLNAFHITNLIVMPQALRAVIPAIMGVFVSLFKDTSLVALIGLFEILGAMRRVLTDTQTGYSSFQREGYLYIGIIYFIFSYLLAVASRRVEQSGSGATRAQRL